jgi:glycosyltransferase involved in cell wall biosynthesis
MKALVIAPQPFFSPRGTPFSVYYRTLVLSEMGVQIDLLTYGEGQDVDLPGVRILRIPRFAFLGPVKIGPSPLKLFLDLFIVLRTLGLLLTRRYDVVHAHEESVFFCRYLKPLFRFKLIYDMHSSLPQQLTNFEFTRSRLLIGLFRALEDTCLAHADAVITICPELAEYAIPRVRDERRHFLIENSIFDDVRLADKGSATEAHDDWSSRLPERRPVVSYAGTFESYQGLDILIQAFAEARRSRPEAFLLMIGGSPPQVERFRSMAREHGVEEHSLFTGRVPQPTAKRLLERADVLTSPRSEGTNTPLKIYEQLASGKPLVATRILSHTQVLTDEVCFLADPEPRPMAEALSAALDAGPRRDRVVAAARALYDERYSRVAYERKVRSLLDVLS